MRKNYKVEPISNMSSQKGNSRRTRGQKYQNKTAFKNNLHETNKRQLAINRKEITGCCKKCREVIEWKIKYKKYKPLTVPKKCVKCLLPRTVMEAYHISCQKCADKLQICAKCGTAMEREVDESEDDESERPAESNRLQEACERSDGEEDQDESDAQDSDGPGGDKEADAKEGRANSSENVEDELRDLTLNKENGTADANT